MRTRLPESSYLAAVVALKGRNQISKTPTAAAETVKLQSRRSRIR